MDEMDSLLAKMEAQQRKAEQIQLAVQRMEVVGRSRNSEVTATLKGSGEFTEIRIDPKVVQRYGPDSVGALVLEAVNDGLRRLAEASQAHFEPLIEEANAEVPDLSSWR